jgi:cell division protein FtsI/penicillin-binding protein 2
MIREDNSKVNRRRLYFLFFLFFIIFGLVIYRLVSIQYIYADKYIDYAAFQHTDRYVINSKRGSIYDRNGVEFAKSIIEKTVFANPKFIKNPKNTAKVIANILGIDENEILEKISDKDLGFVYIARKVNAKDADELARQKLEGIYFENESKRFYPQNDIAASIIGFTGVDNIGLSGIELQYENILKGIDGKFTAGKDVFGNIISTDDQNYIEPINGKDLVLTIDAQIQLVTEKKLEETAKKYNAPKAVAIIMNPNNGEIYAMASYPSFDLNDYNAFDPIYYNNMGIAYTFEPGSTFKVVNIACAIENNTFNTDQAYNLPPSIQVGDRVIKEIFRRHTIDYTANDIIKNSSNVGAVLMALSMGKRLFYESMIGLGFGEITGINMPGEEKGYLADYRSWPASTIGALAIGQSISMTPLQLLRAVSAIANGGDLVTPKILKEIKMGDDVIDIIATEESKKVFSLQTANQVKDMMLSVVEDGTGKQAQIEGLLVCGKTGTAQKANQNSPGYTEGRVVTSFIGFAPYDDPKVAAIVVIDEPVGNENAIWGGTVAAPLFSEIVSFALNKLNYLE